MGQDLSGVARPFRETEDYYIQSILTINSGTPLHQEEEKEEEKEEEEK